MSQPRIKFKLKIKQNNKMSAKTTTRTPPPPSTTTTTSGRRKRARLTAVSKEKLMRVETPAATTLTVPASTTTAAATTTTTKIKPTKVPAVAAATTATTKTTDAAALLMDVKHEIEDTELAADDIKPDLSELNQALLNEANANPSVVLPQSVLPTLFIISQLPANALTPVATIGSGAGITATHFGAVGNANATTMSTPTCATTTTTGGATTTNFFGDTLTKDEFDMQESDSDEEGYSDIDFEDDDELVEDDEESDPYEPTWTEHATAPRMVFKFDSPPQGLVGRPKFLNPCFYMEQILGWKEEFFGRLACGSNDWAKQQMRTNNTLGNIYLKDISNEEMQAFVGICLQMSSMKLRNIADYWQDQTAVWGFKGFAGKMSLNRFQLILSALNFEQLLPKQPTPFNECDTGAAEGVSARGGATEKSFGVAAPLINYFNARMQIIYNCSQRLVLNEPLLYWKGRVCWFSDVSAKFRCNAVLLHLLTEHTGLIQKLVLDVEGAERRMHVRNSRQLVAQRAALAKQVLREKLAKGHTVYASKYYGSYALAHELAAHDTYCTGFVDCKRYGNCKELIMTNLQSKSFVTKYATSIMMGKWRKRQKSIYFFSSDCLAIYAKETSQRTVDKRPKIIKELDWQMRLNDELKEQMLTYQLQLERSELRWDKKLAIYVLNLILFNAFILYTMHAQVGRVRGISLLNKDITKLKTFSEFRQDYISSLLVEHVGAANAATSTSELSKSDGDAKQKRRSAAAAADADSDEDQCDGEAAASSTKTNDKSAQRKLLEVEHMPMIIPRRKGKVMKKKCRICRKGGMLTFSKLCCEVCPGMPGLCETPCFKIWHEQLKKSLEAGESIKTRIFGTSGKETIYF